MTAPVWFDIAEVSAAHIRRQNALFDMHQQWVAEQVEDGVDGPVPPGRKAGSDYNQHFPDLEASGEAEDDFQRRTADILANVQTSAVVASVPAEAERAVWFGCRWCLNPRHAGPCAAPRFDTLT